MPDPDNMPPRWVLKFDRHADRATLFLDRKCLVAGNPERFEINPLTSMWVEVLVMYHLAARDGLLLHGTGVAHRDSAWIFAGRSGTGKSTLARLVKEHADMTVLSDERLVVKKVGNSWSVFGTPWCSSAGTAEARGAPLRGIHFLRHGGCVRASPLPHSATVDRLLPLTTIPWRDKVALPPVLDICDRFLADVPAADFLFSPDRNVVRYIERLGKTG